MITYIRHKDIDKTKWDLCIDKALNGLPYGYSWYLDIATDESWDALILDDYSAVFPLPFKNRIVFKQIYQPFFVQQLGLFYTQNEQANQLHYFINSIPVHFRKINLHLNTQNLVKETFLKVKHRVTHHINLAIPYSEIHKNYGTNTKRNVKKAWNFKLNLMQSIMPVEIIKYRKLYLGKELRGTQNDNDLMRLRKLMEKMLSINKGFISGVSDENGTILALAFFVKSNGHLIFLSAVSSPQGKEKQSMTYLLDETLKTYAESKLIFDFEGSMLPGLSRYYKSFGGQAIEFPVIYK